LTFIEKYLIFLLSFLGTSTQIFVGIFMVIIHMLLTVKNSPYEDDTDDLLAFVSTLCLLLTVFMGLYLKVQGDDTTEEGKFISGVMLTFMYFAVMFLGFFGISMAIPCCRRRCEEKCLRKKFNKEKKKNESTKVLPVQIKIVSKQEEEPMTKKRALKEMKDARMKFGAGSKEYKLAAKKYSNSNTTTTKGKKRAAASSPSPKKNNYTATKTAQQKRGGQKSRQQSKSRSPAARKKR
jgi:hypothetical protein